MHRDRIKELNSLGRNKSEAGRYREALELHSEALALLKGEEANSDEYFETNRLLGENFNTIGEYGLAEVHYIDSCRNMESDLYSHYDNSHYLIFMGDLSHSRGGDEDALEYYTAARDIRAKFKGEISVEVAEVDLILGEYYSSIGVDDKALEWYGSAYNIYVETLGEGCSEIARYYTLMGSVMREGDRLESAEEMFEKAAQIQLSKGSEQQIELANTLENWALLLRDQERYDEAISKVQQAIKIYKECYPANHHYIAGAYNIWGTILSSDEKPHEAMALYNQALELQCETLTSIHFDLADSYINIGTAHLQSGYIEYAMANFMLAEQIEGSIHYLGHCHKALGCMALIESRFEDAHRELYKAIEIYSKHVNMNHIDIVETNCYIEDLRQRIKAATNCDLYMDSEQLVYGATSDNFDIYYTSNERILLKVPVNIGASLIGYDNSRNIKESYIECFNSVLIPIPDSVTTIRSEAFAMNESVTRVHLPYVTKVEAGAFRECCSLREFSFAEDADIDESAFEGCNTLINL